MRFPVATTIWSCMGLHVAGTINGIQLTHGMAPGMGLNHEIEREREGKKWACH